MPDNNYFSHLNHLHMEYLKEQEKVQPVARPAIGRIVYFYPSNIDTDCRFNNDSGSMLTAIISDLDPDQETIDVHVFTHKDSAPVVMRTTIMHIDDPRREEGSPSWAWPIKHN